MQRLPCFPGKKPARQGRGAGCLAGGCTCVRQAWVHTCFSHVGAEWLWGGCSPLPQTSVNSTNGTAPRSTRRDVYGVLITVPGAPPCSATAALASAPMGGRTGRDRLASSGFLCGIRLSAVLVTLWCFALISRHLKVTEMFIQIHSFTHSFVDSFIHQTRIAHILCPRLC